MIKFFSAPIFVFAPTHYCACSIAAGEWKFPNYIAKKKLKVIKNGIDLTLFSPKMEDRERIRKKHEIGSSTLVVGHIGRFSVVKNHTYIIQVFEQLKVRVADSKLMLVGDGELMEQIKSVVKQKGLESDVLFIGRVNNVHDYCQAMDVFVFPSLWEGLGLVGVEAQGVGIPVIASTNVPQEMKLTSDVTYLSLDSVDAWVDRIITGFRQERHDNVATIKEQGYDINQTAEEIRKIYLNQ